MDVSITEKITPPVSPMILDVAYRFADSAQNYFPDSSVYLFGSQVDGRADKLSDIDIAVVIDAVKDVEQDHENSYYASLALSVLSEEYDDPIEAHLVESRFETSGFLSTILDTGILLRSPLPRDLQTPITDPVNIGKSIVDDVICQE